MRLCFLVSIGALIVLSFASPSFAYLGGFEPADGYLFSSPSGWFDVTNYNAGQFGANAGGGIQVVQAPNAGLWKLTSSAGDFFPNSASRNTYIGSAPPYIAQGSIPAGTLVSSYMIGNHANGRGGTTALVIRNANDPGVGFNAYDYTLDTYDFGGVAPASITSGNINTGFYFESNTPVAPNGSLPGPKFIMSFTDSAGSVGFQWGYDTANQVMYRAGSSGTWIKPAGFTTDDVNYDGLNVDIDLSAQTFKIDYYDVSSNTTSNLAPATALGAPMADFTHIGWSLADDTDGSAVGYDGKQFFDDFSFKVPEPASLSLIALAIPFIARRRR